MEHFTRPLIFLLFSLIPVAMPLTAIADAPVAAPREYTAVYEILRGDEKAAKVTISLTRQRDQLTLHGYTHDMRGFAELLNVKGEQSVRGTWQDGRFQPEKYEFSFSLIGYKSTWQAEYDWPAGIVTTRNRSDKFHLPLAEGAVDPFSLFLNTSTYLSAGKTRMEVDIVDEDEIKHHLYVAEPEGPLETALGCLETTRVKRIRKNEKRTSLAWYANEYDYIPVLLQHKKKRGQGLKMRIISLVIDGQQVSAPGTCKGKM